MGKRSIPPEGADLGMPVAEYASKSELRILAIIFAILGMIFIGAGALSWLGSPDAFGLMFFLCGALMLPAGLVSAYLIGRTEGIRVIVFTEGIFRQERGRIAETMCWRDLAEFKYRVLRKVMPSSHGVSAYINHEVSLVSRTGQTLSFGDKIARMDQLAGQLWSVSRDALLPKAIEDYRTGKLIRFGPISVSDRGLTTSSYTYDWSGIDEIVITNGKVGAVLIEAGKRSRRDLAPAAEVSNLPVFLAIIDQAVGLHKLKRSVNLQTERLWLGFDVGGG